MPTVNKTEKRKVKTSKIKFGGALADESDIKTYYRIEVLENTSFRHLLGKKTCKNKVIDENYLKDLIRKSFPGNEGIEPLLNDTNNFLDKMKGGNLVLLSKQGDDNIIAVMCIQNIIKNIHDGTHKNLEATSDKKILYIEHIIRFDDTERNTFQKMLVLYLEKLNLDQSTIKEEDKTQILVLSGVPSAQYVFVQNGFRYLKFLFRDKYQRNSLTENITNTTLRYKAEYDEIRTDQRNSELCYERIMYKILKDPKHITLELLINININYKDTLYTCEVSPQAKEGTAKLKDREEKEEREKQAQKEQREREKQAPALEAQAQAPALEAPSPEAIPISEPQAPAKESSAQKLKNEIIQHNTYVLGEYNEIITNLKYILDKYAKNKDKNDVDLIEKINMLFKKLTNKNMAYTEDGLTINRKIEILYTESCNLQDLLNNLYEDLMESKMQSTQ